MKTTDANRAFLPEHVTDLVVRPVIAESIAAQVATVVNATERNTTLRVPIVAKDPTAAWTAEGEEIQPSDMTLAEAAEPYRKLAGLTIVSNELANDSDPEALEVVGAGLARDIARKLDEAFFGKATPNGPTGLEGIEHGTINGGSAWTNLDAFVAASAKAELAGTEVTAYVASPADALLIGQLKESQGSNRGLLQPDATSPTGRVINGRPLYVTPAVTEGTVWAIPQTAVFLGVREDATVEFDSSAFFTSDRTAVRAIMRAAVAHAHPAGIIAIKLNAG